MSAPYNDKADVLSRARDTLAVVQQAVRDIEDPRRRLAALRNIVVFGRSVTNIVENLRSRVEGFDEWYKPLSARMAADPMLKFFYNLRSVILKEGAMSLGLHMRDMTVSSAEIQKLPRPRGAKDFFIGDRTGGSGWHVEVAPGVVEPYYIELPKSWGDMAVFFADAPGDNKDALGMCKRYVGEMEAIVKAAEERWR